MLSNALITFRETLEAALLVGIVFSYLIKTKQTYYNRTVYFGIFFGIVASLLGALAFMRIAGGFEGRAEQIFEGTTMIAGALLLTTMILWMMRQESHLQRMERTVAEKISGARTLGLFLLVFTGVVREGLETVIFLGAANAAATHLATAWAAAGIVAAIGVGYAVFAGSRKMNLKKFFTVTNILLIFFAAGLIARSVHEFQEANIIPMGMAEVWNINPPVYRDGTFPVWHDNGPVGGFLKNLFGYNGHPSLAEVVTYLVYLVVIFSLWKNIEGRAAKRSVLTRNVV